jgi:hypothetical protein
MRHLLVIGLLFLTAADAVGADKPIPQDPARSEKRRSERLEWNRRTLQGAYDKVGKKSPKWDKAAHEAMELAARMFSLQIEPAIQPAEIYKPAKTAVDAGCDDTMVVYLSNRFAFGPDHPGEKEAIRRMKASAKALAASQYPAIRRAMTLQVAGDYAIGGKESGEETRKEAEHDYDAALALLPTSVATDERNEFWEDRWLDTFNSLIQGYRALGIDAQTAYGRVDAALAKIPGLKGLRLQLRGFFLIASAQDTRGTNAAAQVPAEAMAIAMNRMRTAGKALKESWEVRPSAKTAYYLMGIEKALGGGDRAAMELWFNRAMTADGDLFEACLEKLDWLDPHWHGTSQEMIAFGRACAATKNWRTGITLLIGDAHIRVYSMLPMGEKTKYMSKPEVWSDVKPVFDEYLKHFPNDAAARSRYAELAYQTGHFPEAHAQFEKLGDRLTTWRYYPFTELEFLKQDRAHTARIIAGKPGGNAPGGALAGWLGFGGRNSDGSWTVSVPARPERKQEAGILGAKQRNVFACTADGVTYTVRVQPVPPAAAKAEEVKTVLNAARDAIAKGYGGKVVDEHPVTLGESPGQEYKIDAPALRPAVVRVRLAIIGTRLYEVSALATETDVTTTAAAKFLDSFKFQK